ncbi:hypothetical protein [Prauserella cavernicola]|uniref:Uncharacterized protein n=1 Tax=Prauserella cavernicola TaxID=2800127 RepID=A0A934V3M5_9PSEU|nr:hypothetical protein [Prauserella cavernicola]MBK1787436.1 hypothetical protein [Prauserella cavernicola]
MRDPVEVTHGPPARDAGQAVRSAGDSLTPPSHSEPGRLVHADLAVFADYNYFLVQDDSLRPDLSDEFAGELIDNLVATEQDVLGVGTARRTTVPVALEVSVAEPDRETAGWDHVAEGGLRAPTGRIIVSSSDRTERIPRTDIPPGEYTARVYYRGLDTISGDGRDGHDRYLVVLWPGQARSARVITRYDGELPGG